MRVTVLFIAALASFLGPETISAADIRVFIARPTEQSNLRQDDVLKPGTKFTTQADELVVLLESETVTRATKDRNGQECQYWTVIPANMTHVVKSAEGAGCGNDARVLDRALASAESGQGRIAHAAFSIVHPPAVGKGDMFATDSEARAREFASALRNIPEKQPTKPKGPGDIFKQPDIREPIEPKMKDKADAAWTAAKAERVATLKKGKTAKGTEEREKERLIRAQREAEERRRRLGKEPQRHIDPNTANAKEKLDVVLAMIKGGSIGALSAETGLPADTILDWYRRFVAGGQASLEGKVQFQCEEEISELEQKVGELFMENARLREDCKEDRR